MQGQKLRRRTFIRQTGALAVCPALLPLSTAAVTWAGKRTFVKSYGDGPNVMLVPGLGCSADVWDGVASKLIPSHRVHVVQIAGFGREPARANAQGDICARVADELAEFIAIECPSGLSFIGHSVGGEIGLMLAARHGASLSNLMIVDALPDFASLIIGDTATPLQRRDAADQIVSQIMNASPAEYMAQEKRVVQSLVLNAGCQDFIVEQELESDRGVIARCVRELMLTDLRVELHLISIPTTVLYAWAPSSTLSRAAVDRLFAQAYTNLQSVQLHCVEQSGHFIFLDQPEYVDAAVRKFLPT